MKLERAQQRDSLPVLRLYQLCSRQSTCAWTAGYPGMAEVQADLARGNLYILREGNQIVACCSLILPEEGAETGPAFTPARRPCAMARLGVLPACQGRGYGKAMLCSLMRIARAQGYDAARLLVSPQNAPALHLYEAAGFIAVGETDAYGMHWLQMELLLTL